MKGELFKIAFFTSVAIVFAFARDAFSQKKQQIVFSYDEDVSSSLHKSLQDKYWFYRYRLKTEFLKQGIGEKGKPSGYSIPACHAYRDGSDMLHFGDGTSFLGNYIGVLATEYRLLQQSFASKELMDSLKKELYEAMMAYERLDYNAEIIVSPFADTTAAQLNGFFLRDDVDVDSYLTDFSSPYDPTGKLKTVVSDYEASKDADACSSQALRFPTVDQISNLMVGFALVVKCLGDEFFEINGTQYHFKDKAKSYTHTIMTYMKGVNYLIKHPIEGCPVRYNEGGYLMAYGLAHAAQAIVEERFGQDQMFKVSWDKNNYTFYESPNTFLSSSVWQNNINYPQGKDYFRQNFEDVNEDRTGLMRFNDVVVGAGGLYSYTDPHDYNNAIVAQTAAISNVLRVGVIPYTQKVKIKSKHVPLTCYDGNIPQYVIGALGSHTRRFPFLKAISQLATALPIFSVPCDGCLPELSINTTAIALSSYGDIADIQYFATLHEFLHGNGVYNYDRHFLLMLLQEAPYAGPHYKPFRDPYNPHESGNWNVRSESEGSVWWRQDNRWEKSSRNHLPDYGAWNGLDYMIAYNLFLLVNKRYYDMPIINIQAYKQEYLNEKVFNVLDASDLLIFYKAFPQSPITVKPNSQYKIGKSTMDRFKSKRSLALFWHPLQAKDRLTILF